MAFKFVLLCVSAFLVQTITSQCIGNAAGLAGNGLAGAGLGLGLAGANLNGVNYGNQASLTNGGGLVVTSTSPIAPTGISVLAENLLIEGPLNVAGQLPLLGTVAFESQLPTGGQAGVQYACGNGNVGIVSEGLGGYGQGLAGTGLGNGIGPAGLGLAGSSLAGAGNGGLGLAGCGRLY